MMMNQAAPTFGAPYTTIENEQNNTVDILDFARLFEEEAAADAFLAGTDGANAADMAPRPIAPSSLHCFQPNPTHLNQQQSPVQQQEPLVNVLFVVDPTTQQLISPRQSTFNFPNDNKNSMTTAGLLNNFFTHQYNPNWNIQQAQEAANSLNSLLAKGTQQAPFSLPNFPFLGGYSNSQDNGAYHQVVDSNIIQQPQQEAQPIAQPSLPPLRALSAYNFFFRDERDRILHDKEHDWTIGKQENLLQEHWSRDRTKKRRHRKTHGKIDFTTLSKLISTRWKELAEGHKEFYRQVAARDWERYQSELTKYKSAAVEFDSISNFQPIVR
jgi:hypothetical protein